LESPVLNATFSQFITKQLVQRLQQLDFSAIYVNFTNHDLVEHMIAAPQDYKAAALSRSSKKTAKEKEQKVSRSRNKKKKIKRKKEALKSCSQTESEKDGLESTTGCNNNSSDNQNSLSDDSDD